MMHIPGIKYILMNKDRVRLRFSVWRQDLNRPFQTDIYRFILILTKHSKINQYLFDIDIRFIVSSNA